MSLVEAVFWAKASPMPFTFWLDRQQHRAIMERSRLLIEDSHRLLEAPVWPREYIPPMFPLVEFVPRHRPDDELENAWARIAPTIFDPIK